MRQFSVGEVVTWIPDLLLRWETHGDYRIIAAMPDQDGRRCVYRIKSPLEEYERVVKRGPSCQIEWLFARARRGSSTGVTPQLNHAADSATRVRRSASDPTKAISQVRLKPPNDSSLRPPTFNSSPVSPWRGFFVSPGPSATWGASRPPPPEHQGVPRAH